ncbi:fasciclin domain-containing protein [Egbenema bharatensis]|uniref:fasciclin domain-containing protein n=1 Tax=Egbenema bharatensis TaxID=3463334 RepID=UPI003A85B9A8
MLNSIKFSRKLLAGVLGVSLVGALAACAPPTDTAADAPTADTPTTATDPAVGDDPVAGEGTATTDDQAFAGDETVVEIVQQDASFSTLEQAIQAAELEDVLADDGPYTVFAPTDEAFAALPPETLDQLLQPENQDALRQILTYHVVPGSITSPSVTPGEIGTVEGSSLVVDSAAGEVLVDGARVIQPDIIASNGVVHAIDQVLLPPGLQLQ